MCKSKYVRESIYRSTFLLRILLMKEKNEIETIKFHIKKEALRVMYIRRYY